MFARQAIRRFTTSAIRRDSHYDAYDGVPGHVSYNYLITQ